MSISYHLLKTRCKLEENGQCPCLVELDEPKIPNFPDSRFVCAIANVTGKKSGTESEQKVVPKRERKRVARKLRDAIPKKKRAGIAQKPLCRGHVI